MSHNVLRNFCYCQEENNFIGFCICITLAHTHFFLTAPFFFFVSFCFVVFFLVVVTSFSFFVVSLVFLCVVVSTVAFVTTGATSIGSVFSAAFVFFSLFVVFSTFGAFSIFGAFSGLISRSWISMNLSFVVFCRRGPKKEQPNQEFCYKYALQATLLKNIIRYNWNDIPGREKAVPKHIITVL